MRTQLTLVPCQSNLPYPLPLLFLLPLPPLSLLPLTFLLSFHLFPFLLLPHPLPVSSSMLSRPLPLASPPPASPLCGLHTPHPPSLSFLFLSWPLEVLRMVSYLAPSHAMGCLFRDDIPCSPPCLQGPPLHARAAAKVLAAHHRLMVPQPLLVAMHIQHGRLTPHPPILLTLPLDLLAIKRPL